MFPPFGLNPNQMPRFPPPEWTWKRAKQALLAQSRQPGQNLVPVATGALRPAEHPQEPWQQSRAEGPAPPMVESRAIPRKKG
jgi:hypothetical protein